MGSLDATKDLIEFFRIELERGYFFSPAPSRLLEVKLRSCRVFKQLLSLKILNCRGHIFPKEWFRLIKARLG